MHVGQEKNNPLFTIIIPIYNAEAYLDRCLNSIKEQTYKNFELILVNDGSTDKSLDICNDYSSSVDNVTIINKQNEGPASARNQGLKIAKGKYVIYIDSDDYINRDMLKSIHDVITTYDDVDAITFKFYFQHVNKLTKSNFTFRVHHKIIEPGFYNYKRITKELYPYLFFIGSFAAPNWSTIYKRDILKKTFCHNTNIVIGEDYAYTYEYYWNCKSIYFLDKHLYYYNKKNVDSLLHTNTLNPSRITLLFKYIYNRLLKIDADIDRQLFSSLLIHIWNYYLLEFANENNITFPQFKKLTVKQKWNFVIFFIKNRKAHRKIIENFNNQIYINNSWSLIYRIIIWLFKNNHIVTSRFMLKIATMHE